MPTVKQNQMEEVPANLRKQLALAVKSIQWSYAIFWSIPPAQSRVVLRWYDGYYNGDIKTRKTVQSVESNADQLVFQRSDQLKELYVSLCNGETNHPAKRPTAALVPEDLSNAEWFFVICMSFEFEINQELPGRTFAKNEPIWLCNAHLAATKVFFRSLLAKVADIQTVVCFPHLGGVVELGTTKLVEEDMNLVHHVKSNFLRGPSATLINDPRSHDDLRFFLCKALDEEDNASPDCPPSLPDSGSDEFADDNPVVGEDSEEEAASEMSNRHFMDDADDDCVSQNYEDHQETVVPTAIGDDAANGLTDTETHYRSLLSNLLKGSHQLILGPYSRNGNGESSFKCWVSDGTSPRSITPPQSLLKKVLLEVPRLLQTRTSGVSEQRRNNLKPESDENDRNRVLSERKRREKINERFLILGSLVPSDGKVDKVSILDHTIEYLRELESKVEELRSRKEAVEQHHHKAQHDDDAAEGTSDNYGSGRKTVSNKKTLLSTAKRKSPDSETGGKNSRTRLRDDGDNDDGIPKAEVRYLKSSPSNAALRTMLNR